MTPAINKVIFAIALLASVPSIAAADVKVRTKTTTGALSTQSITWIKGARLRSSPGIGLDTIDQCDLSRTVLVNDKAKVFMVQPKAGSDTTVGNSQTPHVVTMPSEKKHEGKHGVTTYTTTVIDTGERRQIFGFTARRLKLTTVGESSSDACNPVKTKMESDGWYIDFDINAGCRENLSPDSQAQNSKSDCGDELVYKTIGDAKVGFPVLQTVTTKGQDGRTQTTTTEVLELSQETLDAKLFDVPPDYKLVNSYSELAANGANSASAAQSDPSSFLEQFGIDPGSANGVPATIEPKKTGAIRIGVATPENKSDRKFFNPGLRDKLIAAIGGGNIEAIPLRARSEADAQPEATQHDCDYLLFTDIETIKKSAAGGMFGKVSKLTGANPLNDKYEGKVAFRLYAAGNAAPVTSSAESAKSGGGLNAMSVLQMGMMFSPMMMAGGIGGGMSNMLMSRLQSTGSSMLMQGLMSNAMGGQMSQYQPLDQKEEALLVQIFGQEGKSVLATVQKRQK